MEKVKFFLGSNEILETAINNWLRDKDAIKIEEKLQSFERVGREWNGVVSIWYDEHEEGEVGISSRLPINE